MRKRGTPSLEMKSPSHGDGWRKNLGRGNSLCKGPGVGPSLAGLWNSRTSMAGEGKSGERRGGQRRHIAAQSLQSLAVKTRTLFPVSPGSDLS